METDSGQSSLANSAASTPSLSARTDRKHYEVGRGTFSKSTDDAEHEKRPALEIENLLKQRTRLSSEEAGCDVKKCWNKNSVAICVLLVLVVVVCGVVLAFFLNRSPATEPCSNAEWMYYRKSCYYHNLNRTDWNSSQNFCAQYGATLALMHKEEDLDSIAKVCTIDCWIGLHKTGGEFQWADGTPYDSSLFKVQGRGECAYVKSKTVHATDCKLPRPSICMMKPYQET